MSDRSKIEWTETTWNPTTGCDRISPGCEHCYALTLAKRLKAMGSAKYQTDGDPRTSGPGFGVSVHEDTLTLEPLLGPLPSLDLSGIDWVIAGGESGQGARPMHPAWLRDIRDQCIATGTAFFFKQWGSWQLVDDSQIGADDDRPRSNSAQRPHQVSLDGSYTNTGPFKPGDAIMVRARPRAGRTLDGRTFDQFPPRPQAATQ